MLSIPLSKKTFGIKNQTLLDGAADFYSSIFIIMFFSTAFETMASVILVALDKYPTLTNIKKPQNLVSFWVTFIHLLLSIIISISTGQYIGSVDKRFTKKQSIRIGCITIFHFIYLFNPWIAEYQKNAEEFYIFLHYTVTIYYAHFFCCLVIAAFICWLPWQNQSTRKKPKYKVIYGGNDTKKMPVDSEPV